jgi:hypothetical protein
MAALFMLPAFAEREILGLDYDQIDCCGHAHFCTGLRIKFRHADALTCELPP